MVGFLKSEASIPGKPSKHTHPVVSITALRNISSYLPACNPAFLSPWYQGSDLVLALSHRVIQWQATLRLAIPLYMELLPVSACSLALPSNGGAMVLPPEMLQKAAVMLFWPGREHSLFLQVLLCKMGPSLQPHSFPKHNRRIIS